MSSETTSVIENQETSLEESSLWAEFTEASSERHYCQSWLALLCAQVPSVVQAVLLLERAETGSYEPEAIWPEEGTRP